MLYSKQMAIDTLVLSDTHFSFNSKIGQQKWFPGLLNMLIKFGPRGRRKATSYLEAIDRRTQRQFELVLAKVKAQYPDITTIIHCGDIVAGNNESGICNEASIREFEQYEKTVNLYFPRARKLYGWGNHDIGYHEASKLGRLFSKRIGGVNNSSLTNGSRLLGKPFYTDKLGPWTLVFINTELSRVRPQTHDHEVANIIKELSEQQKLMLANEIGSQDKLIVIGHDPFVLCKKILPHLNSSQIYRVLAGHVHNKKFTRLLRLRFRTARKGHLQIIPSTWPSILNGKGGYGLLDSSSGVLKVESL